MPGLLVAVSATAVDATHVDVDFNTISLAFAGNPSHYTIAGLTVSAAVVQSGSVARITTSAQTPGAAYALFVSGGAGAPADGAHEAGFAGSGPLNFTGFVAPMADPLENLSFEIPDATPGSSFDWDVTIVSTAYEIGDFDVLTKPFEDFEGWFAGKLAFLDADILAAAIATHGVTPKFAEDFEELWGGVAVFNIEGVAEQALFPDKPATGFVTADGFEWAWFGNDNYFHDLSETTVETCVMTGGALFEDFETSSWNTGVAYKFVFSGLGVDLETFAETFETVRASSLCVVDMTLNLLHVASDPYTDGEVIFLDGTRLPEPLNRGVGYYVGGTFGGAFWLSASSPGSRITLLTVGEADLTISADPAVYWTGMMATL